MRTTEVDFFLVLVLMVFMIQVLGLWTWEDESAEAPTRTPDSVQGYENGLVCSFWNVEKFSYRHCSDGSESIDRQGIEVIPDGKTDR
jgi:hypothetical protein